jgi:hypothetical protein
LFDLLAHALDPEAGTETENRGGGMHAYRLLSWRQSVGTIRLPVKDMTELAGLVSFWR